MGEEQRAQSGHCPSNASNYGHIIHDGGIFPVLLRHPICSVWTVHYISFLLQGQEEALIVSLP